MTILISESIKLLLEGSLQRRLGVRFKTIKNPKTGKDTQFQVVRGVKNRIGIGIHTTSSSPQSDHQSIETIKGTVKTNANKMPVILIGDHKGRTHPAGFYHEIGHHISNTPDMSVIRKEKTAWQYVKQHHPEIYKQGVADNTVQDGFGSYIKDARENNNFKKIEIDDSDKVKKIKRIRDKIYKNISDNNSETKYADMMKIHNKSSRIIRKIIKKARTNPSNLLNYSIISPKRQVELERKGQNDNID